jgi:Ca2+-binding EF-hand superfamily protein
MKTSAILNLRVALCALVAVCAITVTQAEETKGKKVPPSVLKKFDINNDGVLDASENAAWQADKAKQKAAMEAKRMAKYDANKDGVLDESELAAEKAAKQEAADKKKSAQ